MTPPAGLPGDGPVQLQAIRVTGKHHEGIPFLQFPGWVEVCPRVRPRTMDPSSVSQEFLRKMVVQVVAKTMGLKGDLGYFIVGWQDLGMLAMSFSDSLRTLTARECWGPCKGHSGLREAGLGHSPWAARRARGLSLCEARPRLRGALRSLSSSPGCGWPSSPASGSSALPVTRTIV